MRPRPFLPAMLVLFAGTVSAETYVAEDIQSDQTWIAAHSPYVIQADIVVGNYADLNIEPGVTVAFDGDYRLEIGWLSRIFARGTSGSPVTFTSHAPNPAPRDWDQITVIGPDPSSFEHCIFEYADLALWLSYVDTPVSFCIFRDCRMGIHLEASSPDILDCTITRCQIGIHLTNNLARPTIHRCNFIQNVPWNVQVVLYPEPHVMIDATDNWWGTDDATSIAAKIHDHLDDVRIHATIDFEPWRGSVPSSEDSWGEVKSRYR